MPVLRSVLVSTKSAMKSTSRSLGMRLPGMKVYKGSASKDPAVGETGYRVYDRYYGRVFTAESIIEGIKGVFHIRAHRGAGVIGGKEVFGKSKGREEAIGKPRSRIYSANLLLCYEGKRAAFEEALKQEETKVAKDKENDKEEVEEEEEEDDDEKTKIVEDMKLIDFAHATRTHGRNQMKTPCRVLGSYWLKLQRMKAFTSLDHYDTESTFLQHKTIKQY
ncbi:inositol polyphosphate kinase-domain-containing protein [Kalaharituber pfeilii]|nr:inositol polyphosphate kinase-domain-containing protein [Kalaharituber pfeilii]